MSIEDLQEQNILLPKDEWGEHRLKTTTRQLPLLILFLTAVAACVLIYLGGGTRLTWIGIVIFFVAFFSFVWLCDRAIKKQRKRVKKEKKSIQKD